MLYHIRRFLVTESPRSHGLQTLIDPAGLLFQLESPREHGTRLPLIAKLQPEYSAHKSQMPSRRGRRPLWYDRILFVERKVPVGRIRGAKALSES